MLMRPSWRRGMVIFYPTCSPDTGKHVDVRRGEGLIVRHRLQHVCNRQAVASAFEERAGGRSHEPPDSLDRLLAQQRADHRDGVAQWPDTGKAGQT
jgi:hypothetical protein